MQALRGEWPCLPFGTVHCPSGLPQGFELLNSSDNWNHGYGSNHLWQLVEKASHMLRLRIYYPENGEIESLERVIKANPDAPILPPAAPVRDATPICLPQASTFRYLPGESQKVEYLRHLDSHTQHRSAHDAEHLL